MNCHHWLSSLPVTGTPSVAAVVTTGPSVLHPFILKGCAIVGGGTAPDPIRKIRLRPIGASQNPPNHSRSIRSLLWLRLAVILWMALTTEALAQNLVTNTIRLAKGYNFVGVMVRHGENRIAQLFPKVPTGTVLFTYDNAAGYSASEFLETEWSLPNLVVPPAYGAILVSPVDAAEVPLVGEPAPASRPQLFTGHQLVAITPEFSAELDKWPSAAAVNDQLWFYLEGRWVRYTYDEFDTLFYPRLPKSPPASAAWYERSQASPANPAGTFAIQPAIYVNNFSPAFGVDVPLGGSRKCIQPEQSSGRLFVVGAQVLGERFNFRNLFIDPRQNLLRYLPGTGSFTLAISVDMWAWQDLVGWDRFTIQGDARLPTGLQGMTNINYTGPLTLPFSGLKPVNLTLQVGQSGILTGYLGNDLNGADWFNIFGWPVSYQWERRTPQGWVDIPGETSTVYRIIEAKPSDAGMYRQREHWECYDWYPNEVEVKVLGSFLEDTQVQAAPALAIEFPTLPGQKYQLQTSEDLQTWTNLGTPIEGTGAPFKQSFSVRSPPQVTWRVQRLQ